MELLITIFISIIVGLISYLFTLPLDGYMDKGMILDFIRRDLSLIASKDIDATIELMKEADAFGFSMRYETYNAIYWDIAKQTKWFTIFMCQKCMGQYVNLFVFCFYISTFNFSGPAIVLLLLSSTVNNYLNVKL